MPEAKHCRRHDLGLLRITGRDACGFLHAQTTQAINDLSQTETRLAAWLGAKGRVKALFDVVASNEEFWLVTDADNADWLSAELQRYVLRADVRLEVATDRVVYSCYGDFNPALTELGIELAPGRVVGRGGALWLQTDPSSALVIGPADSLEQALPGISEADADSAMLASLSAGRPALPAALRERYTPHMLNLDRQGAISFTKGCYPGQEIVARTQNLGTVKRRLYRFAVGTGPRPMAGDAIIDAEDQAVGDVNRVAAAGAGYQLLAVVPVSADRDSFRLESDGRSLTPLELANDA
jgi:hypothetical protein